VDANNFRILESPEIAANAFKTAVIDHHIKKEEFENEPQLVYIDPSASSACELISEILEFSIPVGTLRKEEANVLMSGIMVDTQNFTRTVGTRTFAAALDRDAWQLGSFAVQSGDCVVIGNEGHGVSKAVLDACTGSVIIPMSEGPESLNAAVASGVVMWEAARVRLK
jgi:hypothetical protein